MHGRTRAHTHTHSSCKWVHWETSTCLHCVCWQLSQRCWHVSLMCVLFTHSWTACVICRRDRMTVPCYICDNRLKTMYYVATLFLNGDECFIRRFKRTHWFTCCMSRLKLTFGGISYFRDNIQQLEIFVKINPDRVMLDMNHPDGEDFVTKTPLQNIYIYKCWYFPIVFIYYFYLFIYLKWIHCFR